MLGESRGGGRCARKNIWHKEGALTDTCRCSVCDFRIIRNQMNLMTLPRMKIHFLGGFFLDPVGLQSTLVTPAVLMS